MYLLPEVHRWVRGHPKTADAVHRREMVYPVVSKNSNSLPVSEKVVYSKRPRIPAADERFVADTGANNVGIGGVLCKTARSA